MGKRKKYAAKEKKSDGTRREYKAVRFSVENVDEESGEFSGYAAVFGNKDSGDDE